MSKACEKLHIEINKLPRYHFPFEKKEIYKNGIYFLFEKGEAAHGVDRIVRVGTHTGEDNLYNRLTEHFVNENKDRSIFRKNIGRVFLNKKQDNYLDIWEKDFKFRKNRELFANKLNLKYQKEIEKEVSKYIQKNLSFAIIEIQDKESRLFYESKLISTISLCEECVASEEWLGNFSPKKKIVESGLWLVNELYKTPFTLKETKEFLNKYVKTIQKN